MMITRTVLHSCRAWSCQSYDLVERLVSAALVEKGFISRSPKGSEQLIIVADQLPQRLRVPANGCRRQVCWFDAEELLYSCERIILLASQILVVEVVHRMVREECREPGGPALLLSERGIAFLRRER